MDCPASVAESVLNILQIGLLRIRAKGYEQFEEYRSEADRLRDLERLLLECANEADHLHNLPKLLTNYSAEHLMNYWEGARPWFIENANDDVQAFGRWWVKMEHYILDSNLARSQ